MLNIYFGDMEDAIYNTNMFFRNTYKPKWLNDELSKQMILDVDKSIVLSENAIQSPVLGVISPLDLSMGVKTLILINKDSKHIFNASKCGDNCAKWILKISENKKIVINLRHIMKFGKEPFKAKILNSGKIVHNYREYVDEAVIWL